MGENKTSKEIEEIQDEIKEKREELRKLKEKYTVKGARKRINEAYKAVYARTDLTEPQKIEQFFNDINNIRAEYVEG